MTDDDWFESALTDESDESTDEPAPDDPEDDGADAGGADDSTTTAGPDDPGSPDGEDGEAADVGGGDGEAADVGGGDGEEFNLGDDSGNDGSGDDDAQEASGGEDDGQLFEQDFASELQSAEQAAGESDSPFDGGGDEEFGGGGAFAGGDDGLAGGGMGGEDFGMGDTGVGGGGPTEFDEEVEDSDIDRVDLGVAGLDEMIRGGVPDSSLMAAIGSAGTGKTTFGMQFLQHGLANDERAIYISLEESRERVVRSAEEKGWPFREHLEEDRLAVVDMDPIEMANSLSSIRSDLPRLVDRFGASRLVLDSVSLLEMMYDDRATRRNEIYTFARSLKEAGVTIMLTSEADEDNPYASRHGIVEYLTDAVYILQYVRPSDFRETRLAVEILKIRDAHHSREMKPYEITDDGLSVYRQANIF